MDVQRLTLEGKGAAIALHCGFHNLLKHLKRLSSMLYIMWWRW